MNWDKLVKQWEAVLEANARLGGNSSNLTLDRPATENEVAAAEKELAVALPGSLRELLLNCSKDTSFSWFLPEKFNLPDSLGYSRFGILELSLDRIVESEFQRREWIEKVLSTREDPVLERGWDGVLAVQGDGTGDFVCIDLRESKRPRVVMISHDMDCITQETYGTDFQDFLERWSAIGCVGPSIYIFEAYLQGKCGPIDPEGKNARLLRKTLSFDA